MSQYEWAAYNKKYLNDIHKRWKRKINKTKLLEKKLPDEMYLYLEAFFYVFLFLCILSPEKIPAISGR